MTERHLVARADAARRLVEASRDHLLEALERKRAAQPSA